MVPGMDHCIGGPGPSFVNWVDEIDRWMETDQAPDQVTAYWVNEQMQPDGSRLACAFPSVPGVRRGPAIRAKLRASGALEEE